MHFKTFLKQIPKQEDTDMKAFLAWFGRNKEKFPQSSDPAFIVVFMADKDLAPQVIKGCKKILLTYSTMPNNKLPKRYADKELLFDTVNKIGGTLK